MRPTSWRAVVPRTMESSTTMTILPLSTCSLPPPLAPSSPTHHAQRQAMPCPTPHARPAHWPPVLEIRQCPTRKRSCPPSSRKPAGQGRCPLARSRGAQARTGGAGLPSPAPLIAVNKLRPQRHSHLPSRGRTPSPTRWAQGRPSCQPSPRSPEGGARSFHPSRLSLSGCSPRLASPRLAQRRAAANSARRGGGRGGGGAGGGGTDMGLNLQRTLRSRSSCEGEMKERPT